MKIIKNNWLKLILIVLCLICSILICIPSFMAENITFIGACQTIGLILFFVGIALVLLLGIFAKTKAYDNFVLLGTGILVVIFLAIGFTGLSKNDSDGVLGKSYAYFAEIEGTVKEGETTLALKQAELNAKRRELEAAKVEVTALGLLAGDWTQVATGFTTNGLFGTMSGESFVAGINPASTKIEAIVSNPAVTSENPAYATVVKLIGIKSQLVYAGLGGQTLQSAPYIMGGIITASSQSFPKLEEAMAQLQGVIDMNANELSVGKSQVKDANAAAATIMFLYISLMLGMGVAPAIIAAKKIICKKPL